MTLFYSLSVAPVVIAAVVALVPWLLRAPRTSVATGAVRTSTAVAAGVILLVAIAFALVAIYPFWLNSLPLETILEEQDWRFVLPLILGLATLVVLAFPIGGNAVRGSAELSRRTPLSFARPWRFVVLGVLILISFGLALAAGSASRRDDRGHYTLYAVHVGSVTSETTIYGWFYSVPCLILLAAVAAVSMADLVLISRPALAAERDRDTAVRRMRCLNVVRVGSGAVLIHLSAVLLSLAGTSSLNTEVSTGTVGLVSVGSSFGALTAALEVTSAVVEALGLALWFSTLLSVFPTPLRSRESARVA